MQYSQQSATLKRLMLTIAILKQQELSKMINNKSSMKKSRIHSHIQQFYPESTELEIEKNIKH